MENSFLADNPDTLICGNCKEMFHSLSEIIDHKKHYCKLRFTCKCAPKNHSSSSNIGATSGGNGTETDGRDSGMSPLYLPRSRISLNFLIFLELLKIPSCFRSGPRRVIAVQLMQRELPESLGLVGPRSKDTFPANLRREYE